MNRTDLQRLSELRLREAGVLLTAGEYSGAYYLSGYAVECALKACFAKTVAQFDFPDRNRMLKVYTHRFRDLVKAAGLEQELATEENAEAGFAANWIVVCNWTEESRYSEWTAAQALELQDATTNPKEGVLPWIRRHW